MPGEQGSHYVLSEILEEREVFSEALGAIAGMCMKIAPEFSSWVRTPSASGNVLIVFSQSGESAGIVLTMESAKERKMRRAVATNNSSSSLAKAADFTVLTQVGPGNTVTTAKHSSVVLLHYALAPCRWLRFYMTLRGK